MKQQLFIAGGHLIVEFGLQGHFVAIFDSHDSSVNGSRTQLAQLLSPI